MPAPSSPTGTGTGTTVAYTMQWLRVKGLGAAAPKPFTPILAPSVAPYFSILNPCAAPSFSNQNPPLASVVRILSSSNVKACINLHL